MTDPFAEIRPYNDKEVAGVLARLLEDAEFLDTLAAYRLGRVAALAPPLVRLLTRWLIAREVRGVHDVHSMQLVIERYMTRMIESATGGFSVSGLEGLDPGQPYLYMSNHRDITMDPAFTNYALHKRGRDTVRIAIGDNLLTKPWVSDLMRLNKSFIVKRSVSGPRELLAASKTLSRYIQHSLLQDRAPVWIAQREGRAKDGVDRTEPVIIKMLSMSRDKRAQAFGEHIGSLGIVPVAISYELDPCDGLKANELYRLATEGRYEKGEQEDVASIARGIAGEKGRVHVSFGTPLSAAFDSPEAVAAEVDRQVISGYCLHPTNLWAYRRLHGEDVSLPDDLNFEEGDCSEETFRARIDALPEAHRPYALGIYANAVTSKLALAGGTLAPLLSDDLKGGIRDAYNAIVESKGLTPRWGQRQMIAEIANTLARIPPPGEGEAELPAVCVIEAGTGTGKTIAYAVAAIPMALARGKRLVVATATVALQEQFINKDLPDIRDNSGMAFSYALAKGRRRYVCLSKLDRLIAEGQGDSALMPLYPDEVPAPPRADAMPVYDGMLDALGRGDWDGDRDNWPESIDEDIWFGVTTDHSQCSGRRCPNINQCSFFRARDQLQSADIIVTNHDLVLSDLALGGGAILSAPEDSIYIFDEGHHLPDKALSHFASFCRLHTTSAWLRDSVKSLAQAAPLLGTLDGAQRLLQNLPGAMEDTVAALDVAEQTVAALFEGAQLTGDTENRQMRLAHGLVPGDLMPVAAALAGHFQKLGSALSQLENLLENALDDELAGLDKSDIETWHINIGGMLGRAEGALALWREYAVSGEGEVPPRARWITQLNSAGQTGYELRCSPVLAADILEECLWSRAAGVIVTSATITALNSFDRFRLRSGAPAGANYKVVESPFDYGNATFRVPAMDCDPGDAQAHTEALVDLLPQVLGPAEGSLVLFSSRRQMLDVYSGIDRDLRERVLVQDDYSKQEILRRHRAAIDAGEGSVIFGLASFAEGVDLPGDYCRHVVIAKIPFAVPDSPLEAALAEWVEAQGRNAFMEISVPDAALRLVQASGRLLRTEQDVGRVTLMDRRILTRRYGRAILDSLPPFRRELD